MRRIRPILVAAIAMAGLAVSPAAGQESGARKTTAAGALAVAGLAGGAVGWVVGGVAVGVPLARWNPFNSRALDDDLWTPGFTIGFEAGQALGIPLAVHLANRRRGDFRRSLLVSAGIATLGTALLWTGDFDALFESPSRQAVLIAVPMTQLITSIIIERRTSHDTR